MRSFSTQPFELVQRRLWNSELFDSLGQFKKYNGWEKFFEDKATKTKTKNKDIDIDWKRKCNLQLLTWTFNFSIFEQNAGRYERCVTHKVILKYPVVVFCTV